MPLDHGQISEIVASVISSLEGDLSPASIKLYGDLENLARYIQQARVEIAALHPEDIKNTHIPKATDELDAVVGATAKATEDILDATEAMENIAASLPQPVSGEVVAQVTRIYEACNFQDITGQRITKVVGTLKFIENRISRMLEAFGPGGLPVPREEIAACADGMAEQEALMNGPQLPGSGVGQDEIDRLLAG
ncbi:MAG TPA: hypothetical protein DCW68_03080 [Rhodospirillaceae bacterium]|nr:hypothetical protein [Rhodospirillaceae bacterium]